MPTGRYDMASTQTASTREALGGQDVTTLLGRGSEFEGKLSFEGTVRIDGKLTGEIFTDDVLIIGEGAEAKAPQSPEPQLLDIDLTVLVMLALFLLVLAVLSKWLFGPYLRVREQRV